MRKMFPFNLMHCRTRSHPQLPCDTLYKDEKCSGLKPSTFKQDHSNVAETTNYLLKAERLERIAVRECHLLQGKPKAWTSAKDEQSQGTWLGSPFQSLDGGQRNSLYAYGKAYKLNVFLTVATRKRCQHPVTWLRASPASQAAASSSGWRAQRAGLRLNPPARTAGHESPAVWRGVRTEKIFISQSRFFILPTPGS